MIEIEKFNGNWKVIPTAVSYPLSNDAVAILLHLIGKSSKWKTGFMPDEPIPISKNELTKLTDKCWRKIDESIQELIDFNFVSEFKYQPTAPSCVVINWEEIWKLQQAISKISTLGRIELRKKMRKDGFTAFTKLPKNDVDDILNKYAYNLYEESWENTNNINLAYDQGSQAYDERLEASYRRLEAYALGSQAYDQGSQASNDLSYVLDKFSTLIHDVCEKDVELAEMTQNTIISCVEKLSHLMTTDHKLMTTDQKLASELMTTDHNSNKYIYKNNKNQYTERSEVYIKGENKEKVEVEGEPVDHGELPVDLNNFYDSFWEKFLGISSLKIKRTPSNENFIDRVIATETLQEKDSDNQEQSGGNSQDKKSNIWNEARNLDYPLFPARDMRRILDGDGEFSEDIHKLIKTVWDELIAPLPESDEDEPEEADEIPVNLFHSQLEQIIQDFQREDPEFSITFKDALNIFGFDVRLDEEVGEFVYQISQRQVHDIRHSQQEEKHTDTPRQFSRSEQHLYREALDELAEQDRGSSQLTPIEKAVYFLKYDIDRIMEHKLTILGASRDDRNVLFVSHHFNHEIDGWAGKAGVDAEDLRQLTKVFRRKANKVVVCPTKIEIGKIMDWNKQHSQKSKVEILWKQKMAESQV